MLKVSLTWNQAFPKGAILADIKPWYTYTNNQRDDAPCGLTYVLVNRSGYDKVNVKVRSQVPIITKEELEASTSDIMVEAEGFEGSIYNSNNGIAISGRANKVVLVK